MSHKIIKFGMLALVALALTYCQREDAPEAPQQDPVPAVDPQAVVSLDEAKSLFEASENQKRTANSVSRRKYPFIELETDWRYFEQMKDFEEMPYAKVPVRISKTELNGEVLFLKKDGKTKQYLFLTQIDSIMADRRIINADFYLLDTKGVFLSAYRMTDGVITHKIVPKRKGSYRIIDNNEASATAEKPICRSCPFIIAPLPFSIDDEGDDGDQKGRGEGGGGGKDYFMLEPVTVYGRFPRKSRNKSDFPHYTYYDYSPYGYGDFYDDRDREDKRIALQELREKRRAIGGGGSSSNVGAGMAKEEEEKEEKKQDKREDTIKDSLTNPCAKALLAQAPNLNNDIARLMRNTFGTSDKFNITVHNKSFATDTLHKGDVAYTVPKGSISGNVHTLDCDIYLNDDIITRASQEYILATIYHEVIHSYLIYELQTLGAVAFNQKYPSVYMKEFPIGNRNKTKMYTLIRVEQHDKFSNFIESLAQSIMSFPNTKISLETARAMAKAGVVEETSLSEKEKDLDKQQKLGKSGTTCTP
ncbi:hypothetical protein [Capnocytophaga sp. oral taxon 323]|uniref:hypothetical protein n=1 Tax=Capnocytophaga sp. oral taxon 323 TaxID=1705617 RepID=UPI0006AFC40D|nr:hypothetical protein [Capnocytophaga sp. oral taxon 323]ALC96291.1 hypothetical protein AM608_00790 [Capnocytophaga sp. oral taxon 323]